MDFTLNVYAWVIGQFLLWLENHTRYVTFVYIMQMRDFGNKVKLDRAILESRALHIE